MTTLPSHPSPFVFPFSVAQQPRQVQNDDVAAAREEPVDRLSFRRPRSNSLPLPGAWPFTPEQVDFQTSPISPLSPFSLMGAGRPENDDDVVTPIPERAPQFPEYAPREQDLESIIETDEDYDEVAEIDDEAGDVSTIDSFVIHETAEATATTPTFYKAQSVRIISTGSAPVGFNITERKSSSTISTLREKEGESDDRAQSESPVDRQAIVHSPEEIGIARTSDVSIPPSTLPTPVQSPIVNENEEHGLALTVRRPSADSSADSSTSATKDIAKERRRRSKYYQPAPAPHAPDFYPEHHTEDEIVQYRKQSDDGEPRSQISQVLHIRDEPTAAQAARKSAREELLDLYSHDPDYDEEDEPEPVKRQTKPARSLRGASPFGSPDLSQTAKSTHSDSSESLTGRSHSSGALSADRRQYPSFDLPRPNSNRDVSTPTSAHNERAGLRVWTPPATPDASKGGRFKATLNKTKGHGHSNSMSSQTSAKLKNFIGGRPTTADEKRQGSRQDWDNESAYSDTHASKIDEKERSFEQLINSGTTLQYTLTPDNVKRIDLEVREKQKEIPNSCAHPLRRGRKRSFMEKLTSLLPCATTITQIASSRKGSGDSGRTKGSINDKYVPIVTTPVAQSPQPGRSNSLKSRPLTTIASDEYEDVVPDIPSKSSRSPRIITSPRSANSDNIKFFPPRSTSTASGTTMPQTSSQQSQPRGIAGLHSINTSTKPTLVSPITIGQAPLSPLESPKSAVTPRSPLIPRRPTANSLDEIRPLRSAGSRGKLVARAPQPATADSTLALIDFFKNTPPPPPDNFVSNPPPVRTPYRSVMDPKYGGSAPQESMTSIAEKSTSYSSFHSQADLIKKPEPPKPGRIPQRPQTDGGPTRKQVRVRDPYAIDSDDDDDDDDEDDDLFDRPPPKRHQEESLIDFLMNAPPPPESPAPSQESFPPPKPLKKKSSAAQLIGRFRSSSKNQAKITKANVSAPVEARQPPRFQSNGLNNGSVASLPQRKHVPLPVKTAMEAQFPPRSQSSGMGMSPSMMMPRKQSFQARDAKTYTPDSDSSGLADFLRYTGPADTPEPAPPVSGEKFKGGAKKKRGIAI
ncbi:hypothetical protein ABW20_dc0104949 [Dactylellina cionopaga]|nr:hypothetical protein ABW20_dc0104949 [Dactylellina cionopaga]